MISAADLDLASVASHPAVGRRGDMTVGEGHGRYVRGSPNCSPKGPSDIAIDATLRAVAKRAARDGEAPLFPPQIGDLRFKLRQRPRRGLLVFVLDASVSMGAAGRMAAAKGAILALLTPAYQRRDRVALVVFRDEAAEVLLPPTRSVTLARQQLRRLPTGGATPLAEGLLRAWRLVRTQRRKTLQLVATLVLISDGDANVPLGLARDCDEELLQLAAAIRDDRIGAVAIDTLTRRPGAAPMRRIAEQLGARYHHIDHLRASAIVQAVEGM